MEDKIKSIKESLTGDYQKDLEILDSLYDEENEIIEDAKTTIEAINTIVEEISEAISTQDENEDDEKEEEQEVEKTDEQIEIENLIRDLLGHIDKESDDEAIASIEKLLPKIENLTKSDDNTIYCSFSSEFERVLFEKIFAGEKKVIPTPYANDKIYIIYADLLTKKKKRMAAMDALDRAIYWNFLNREAREKKLDIYLKRKEIVKYLDTIKSLQMIAYVPQYIADCYNKYGYIFNYLKDNRASYAMYRLSYSYYQSKDIKDIITSYEDMDITLKEMTQTEIIKLAEDNDVLIGANYKIVKAHRDITKELIDEGLLEDAKIMLRNDYAITNDEGIADLYNQLVEISKPKNNTKDNEEKKPKAKKEEKKSNTKKTAKKTVSAS